jgi:hypothetical protein
MAAAAGVGPVPDQRVELLALREPLELRLGLGGLGVQGR